MFQIRLDYEILISIISQALFLYFFFETAIMLRRDYPKKSKISIKPQDKVDIYGIQRSSCTNCSECPQFISVSGHVLCAYCGCPPAKHDKVSNV